METEARLPTGLWVEIHLRNLEAVGTYYYYIQKGNHASGLLLLKLNSTKGQISLLEQERNFETGKLEWVNALNEDHPAESAADEYIQRAIARDPDLWVIEVEDPELKNPFED